MFEYEGQEITLAQIEAAARASGMSIDDYKSKVGIKELGKLGKTSPTPQRGAEIVGVAQAPDTVSPLEPGSSGFTKEGEIVLSGTEIADNQFAVKPVELEEVVVTGDGSEFEKRQDRIAKEKADAAKKQQAFDRQFRISQIAAATKIPEFGISVSAGLAATTTDIVGGLFNLVDKYGVAPMNYAIGSYLGYDTTLEAEARDSAGNLQALNDVSNFLRQYQIKKYDENGNEQDVVSLIEKDDYANAAELAFSEGFSAAPYLALSIAAPGAGSALIGMSVAGQEVETALNERTDATLAEIYGASALKGGVEFATNMIGGGLQRGILGIGKKLGVGTNAYKKAVDIYTKTYLGKIADTGIGLTKGGVINFFEEFSASTLSSLTDVAIYEDKYERDSIIRQGLNEGIVGAALGAPIGSAGAFNSIATKQQALEFLAPKKWTADLAKQSRRLAEAKFDLEKAPEGRKEKFQKKVQKVESIIEMKKKQLQNSFDSLTKKEKKQYAANLAKADGALASIGNNKYSASQQVEAQQDLNDANAENEVLVGKGLFDAKAEEAIGKVLKNSERLAEAAKKAKGISRKDLKIKYIKDPVSDEDAIFLRDENGQSTIFINTTVAEQTGQTNVLGHELLHYIINNKFKTDNESIKPLVDSFKEYLKESQPELYNRVQERIDVNYTEINEQGQKVIKEGALEEYFNVFSDLVAKEKIIVNESLSDKIKNSSTRFLNGLGFGAVKLETGKDVFNFIRNYQKNISNFKFKQLGVDIKSSKIPQQVNNEVAKSSLSGENIQNIYNEQGVAGAMDIIEAYKPLTTKLTKKYQNVPGYDFDLLQSEIELGKRGLLDLIQAYDPSKGATLNTYVQGQLTRRTIEAANRILDTEFTEDVTEAKKVAATETADSTVVAEETAPKQLKTTTLADKLGLNEDVKTKVTDAVIKTFGTKLPNTDSTKFKDALIKAYRTELKPVIAKLMGTRANYESFLSENFESIYSSLPQTTINRRFNEFAEPVLDKDGKQLREKTAVGKGIFKKRKIAKAEWLNYFIGRDVAPSKKGTRKTSIAEEIGVEVAFDATLAALSDKNVLDKYNQIRDLQGFSPVNNTIDVVGKEIDRANVKFSNSSYIAGVMSPNITEFIDQLKKSNKTPAATKKILKSIYGDKLTAEDRETIGDFVNSRIRSQDSSNIPEQVFSATNIATFKGKKKVTGTILHLEQKFSSIGRLVEKYPAIAQNALKDIQSTVKNYIGNDKNKAAFVYAVMKDTVSREKNNPLYPLNGVSEYDIWFKNTFGETLFSYAKNNTPDLNIKHGIKSLAMKAALGNKTARKALNARNKIAYDAQKLLKLLYKNSSAKTEVEQMIFSRLLSAAEKGLVRMAAPITTVAIKDKSDINKGETLDSKENGYTYEHRGSQVGVRNALHAYYFLGETSIDIDQVFKDFQIIIAPNDVAKGFVDATYLKDQDPRDHIPGETSVIELTYHGKFLARLGAPMYDLINTTTGEVTKAPAAIKASKSLSRGFNEILEQSTGVEWYKTYSPVKAKLAGKGKGKKFFIPYSADDFVGLLYTTLGKGKVGDQQMEWYEENLLRPFSRGIQSYEAAKQKAMRDWMDLKKEVVKEVPGGLNKTNESGFTNQNSVRMYIWQKQGFEIPGISKKDLNENLKVVNNSETLKSFADRLIALNPEGYPEPSGEWAVGDITTDLVSYINDVRRKEFLTEWKENVDEIFSKENKNKLRALYGDGYIEALDDILHRMATGRNRKMGSSKVEKQFMDWTNNSVGAIMFFNARSAVLQTLSAVNFINFSDNNPINAGLAFANQKQYWKDFSMLFNSDFLKQRRSGLQTDINADEIANAAATSTNKAKAALNAILKFGFTPTQIADSFAIASGGATMYRNRVKKYLKEGLDQKEAEKRAFTDFQEIAEETQQSARPDRISSQQAGSLGRLVLAFGNTPMQYARLTKKATLDLINGRGDWKTNVSKIAYYSVIQNIIFSALQSGMFALLFDEEEDEKKKKRYLDVANKMTDTLLRGTGVYGAAASTVKNMILKIIEEEQKSRPDYRNVAIEATQLTPPINSKIRKLVSAGKTFTYKQSREKVFTEGLSLDNPAFLAAGKVISAGTNLPADRLVQKMDHIHTAMQPETELWQSLALSLGWSEWDLGMIEKQTKSSFNKVPLKRSKLKRSKLSRKKLK